MRKTVATFSIHRRIVFNCGHLSNAPRRMHGRRVKPGGSWFTLMAAPVYIAVGMRPPRIVHYFAPAVAKAPSRPTARRKDQEVGLSARALHVKVESLQTLAWSRIAALALGIIEDAERTGAPTNDRKFIEATSSNTCIGLAMVARSAVSWRFDRE